MVQTAALKRPLQVLLIVALTIALLALFLRNSHPAQVWALIASANPLWLFAGLGVNFLALLSRALRWRLVLDPDQPPPLYPTFFSTSVGFMCSALLPVRVGDVVRPALLSRRTDIRFSTALGTVLTERLLDLSSILILFLAFTLLSQGTTLEPGKRIFLRTAGTAAAALFLILITFVVAVARFRDRARAVHLRVARAIPVRFRGSFINLFDSFSHSLRLPANRQAMLRVLLLTGMIWLCLTSQFLFVMRAFGHVLPYRAAFLVTAMSVLGFAIPTPGGVGGFHKAVQLVLVGFYGFGINASVAITLVYHLVGTLPVVATGTSLFLREGLSWRQIERLAEQQPEDSPE